jgi:hypothetical protein
VAADSKEWVVYMPPKSTGFGHTSRIRDARKSWPFVQKFLRDWTHFELGKRISLTIRSAEGLAAQGADHHVASERLAEARGLFGQQTSAPGVFPGWSIAEKQLDEAIEFALNDDRYASQQVAPSWLYFDYDFDWKTFAPVSPIASCGEHRRSCSDLGVIIGGGKVFLQPRFVFPSPWNSKPTVDFINRIDDACPFRFREQCFRRVLPPKGKASRYGRVHRLPKGWRNEVSNNRKS